MQYTTHIFRRYMLGAVAAGSVAFFIKSGPALAQEIALTRAQKEEFLLKAKVVKNRVVSTGITGTFRATLSDGSLTHDASIQTIDESKAKFEGPLTTEFNFKDSWKFNVAAYKLDRILGLNMVPVTVERRHTGKSASYTWWVDDVVMDEGDRQKKKIEAPDPDYWNAQIQMVRVFDQLIYNMDRNLANLLIDKNWRIWMIDHSRAFRTLTLLKEPKNLARCDQDLLEKLKQLNVETLKKELGMYLAAPEIKGLLARRDRIVKAFEEKGPSALYKSPRRPD